MEALIVSVVAGLLVMFVWSLAVSLNAELVFWITELAAARMRNVPRDLMKRYAAEWSAEIESFYQQGRWLTAFRYALDLLMEGARKIDEEYAELGETNTKNEVKQQAMEFFEKLAGRKLPKQRIFIAKHPETGLLPPFFVVVEPDGRAFEMYEMQERLGYRRVECLKGGYTLRIDPVSGALKVD